MQNINYQHQLVIDRLVRFADEVFRNILARNICCTKPLRSDTNNQANQFKNCLQLQKSCCNRQPNIYNACVNKKLISSYQCECCLEEIHFAIEVGAVIQPSSYLCPHICYVYICKYIHKYASEILLCLEHIDFANLQAPRVLAFGCGPSPEVCALDYLLQSKAIKSFTYTGVDKNSNWLQTHQFYLADMQTGQNSQFYHCDATDFFNENIVNFDILIMSNMLSDIVNHQGKDAARNFLVLLRDTLLKYQHFPKLIFNDINIVYPDRGSIDIIWEVFGNLVQYPNKTCQAFPSRRSGNVYNYRRILTVYDDNPLHSAFFDTSYCRNYGPYEFVSAAQIILQT